MVAAACGGDTSPSGTTGPTIAFLFDGSPSDAELVTSPALAGLELAAHEAGGFEVEPVNVGLDLEEVTTSLRDLGEDRGVVAAVVAPWTAPPGGAIDLLAAEGVPVVTLSWAWGPPGEGDGLWLSFVAPRAREAVILLSAANVAPEGAPLCLAGDDHVTSRALLATATALGEAAGDPEVLTVGIAESGRAASALAVADRIRDSGCPVLVWVGGAEAAGSVLSSVPGLTTVVAGSRMRTDEGLELATSETAIFTVCACVDVSLSTEPGSQRFVHDLQAASGSPPGAFAVEAYDAGTLLIGLLEGGGATRGRVAAGVDDLTRFEGLVERYAFEPDGSRAAGSIRVGRWRATGSRWLPEAAPVGTSG